MPVIRIYNPPKRSRREKVVEQLRSELERGHRRMNLTGDGPDAFEVAYEACLEVSATHALALADRTGVTRQWHRIVRQTDRTTTRSAMHRAPWTLELELLTGSVPASSTLPSDASDVVDLRGGEAVGELPDGGRCYLIGPLVWAAKA